ncbi:BLUF domain-containing protein [Corynebacterium sp.]|uniref:BLUF domain-containing protein n=1 Tax=Corynebacterium sp. TaxID=1720 RepID=UPI003735B393
MDAILTVARQHNASAGITGLLLLRGGMFVQFLEGSAEEIDQLLASIRQDVRHTDVKVIIEEPVDRRRFPDWRMGFRRPKKTSAPHRSGVRDSFHDLTSGSAREVVERAATEFSLWFRVTEGVTG